MFSGHVFYSFCAYKGRLFIADSVRQEHIRNKPKFSYTSFFFPFFFSSPFFFSQWEIVAWNCRSKAWQSKYLACYQLWLKLIRHEDMNVHLWSECSSVNLHVNSPINLPYKWTLHTHKPYICSVGRWQPESTGEMLRNYALEHQGGRLHLSILTQAVQFCSATSGPSLVAACGLHQTLTVSWINSEHVHYRTVW